MKVLAFQFILIALLFTIVLICAPLVSPQTIAPILLDGYIFDENGNIIPHVELRVEDQTSHQVYVIKSDANGRYELNLPESKYQISARKFGFCPEKRSDLDLRQPGGITINMRMIVCEIATVIKTSPENRESGSFVQYTLPYFHEKLPTGSTGVSINISYGLKHICRGKVIYKEITGTRNNRIQVQLTYGNIRITSDSIEMLPGSFKAVGTVVLEDGKTRFEFTFVEFKLESGRFFKL